MSCKHPLKGWHIGFTDNGKKKYMITSYDVDHLEYRDGKYIKMYRPSCLSDISLFQEHFITEFIEIPCGKCLACRMKYSRDWADRCIMELPYHDSSYFVTLTYDNDHLPVNDFVDPVDGVIGQMPTLIKSDVSDFMKNLRRQLDYHFPDHAPISFFAAGEYGGQTSRPHYHLIIFGLQLNDLQMYKKSTLGYNYYNSEFLQSVWKKGYVVVADVTWQSAAYVARYILKKQTGDQSEVYDRFNFQQEFSLMSRRPSIGRRFFEEHFHELYEFDSINVPTSEGGRKVRPNRYFDRLMAEIDPDKLECVKQKRADFAKVSKEIKLSRTDKTYMEMLETEEDNLIDRLSKLPRMDI